MATYSSRLIAKRTKHRGIYEGQEYTVEGKITLPEGTVLTSGDVLKFVPLGENQVVTQVWAYIVAGTLPSATASIGYAQRLDAAGDPEVTRRRGPFGEASDDFESPASDLDAFAAAAVLSTARKVTDTAVEKLAGPVDLAIEIGTGGTVGTGGVEIHVGAVIIGEQAPDGAGSSYDTDNSYLLENA